jgi:hypothetical protein
MKLQLEYCRVYRLYLIQWPVSQKVVSQRLVVIEKTSKEKILWHQNVRSKSYLLRLFVKSNTDLHRGWGLRYPVLGGNLQVHGFWQRPFNLKGGYGFFLKKIFWFPMLLKKIFWFWWRKKKIIWFRVFVI